MSAFLGIALGFGCALTFTYLAARISVLIWNDSIQKAVTDYAVRKRLREVCGNARDQRAYGDHILLPPEFFGNVNNAPGGSVARAGGRPETDTPRRNATHGAGK
jgi:hypothetical protein